MMYQNAIYICISAFCDIATFPDFDGKNADARSTQGGYHVIHIFFGSSLGNVITVPSLIFVGYV